MVIRTYTTGISLSHIPRNQRGIKRKKLAAIVNQLCDENTKLNVNKIRESINYLMFDKLKNIRVCDRLNLKDVAKGKYEVNAMMKDFNNASNHLHSGYNQLLITSKGYLNRVSKVQEFMEFLQSDKIEFVKWILWGRSVYTNQVLSKKWKVKFTYVDRMMAGVHNTYFEDKSLPCFALDISVQEFKGELSKFIQSFKVDTENKRVFLNRLEKIEKLFHLKQLDLSFIPLGWKNLKLWLDGNGLPRTYLSAFIQILSQVYLKHYMRMINTIYTAKIEELLTIPFSNDKEYKLPYLMVSGPKYVVRRVNNRFSWKSMQSKGFFELEFKFLEDKWKDSVKVRVKASRKIRLLQKKDIKLNTMIVMPPRNGNVNIHLVFSGKIEKFISTKHLKPRISNMKKTDVIGVDINRRGEYAIVTNLNIKIPDDINRLSEHWDRSLVMKTGYQQLLERNLGKNQWEKRRIYAREIDNLHKKIKNIRKTYHLQLANFLGQQILSSEASHLVLENLDVNTMNTRGALARAITSMADDTSLYAREVLALRLVGVKCKLHFVSPYHTSTKHANCGGKIKRSSGNYDIAPCDLCHKMVNTHLNAAINLASSTIRS